MSEHRLDKIIVERPRKGKIKTPKSAKKYQQTYDDEFSSNEPKCRFKTKYKSDDNLTPLKRFLFSRVGQPWNDVYSELCRRFDKRTLTGYHLFEHLESLVVRHVEFIEGIPLEKCRSGYPNSRFLGNYGWFYVHPETGILSAFKFLTKSQRKKQIERLKLDEYHQYIKLENVWYLVTFTEFSSGNKFSQTKIFDVLIQEKLDYWTMCHQYHRQNYAIHKRHCTKKEIKQIIEKLKHED